MKFEAIEASHRTLTALGDTFKDLVHMNTLVPAYAKQCAVDKADSGAFPHTAFLHKENERDYNSPFKFSKSIVHHCLWKYISHMFLNFIDIEMLETFISAQVEQNHYGYDLRREHSRVEMILAFGLVALRCKTVCLDESVIKFEKSSDIQKISVILSLEIIAMYFVKLICRDFKFTKYIAILLIINNLIPSN